MKWIGRARPVLRRGGRAVSERSSARAAATARAFSIGNCSCLSCPASTIVSVLPRPPAVPRRIRGHAVFHLSARAHGLDHALAAGAVRRGLLCRADPGLHRRHVRHRRHRHAEDLVADHLRHEQAAVRQAAGGELHHGRGEQRRQARSLVRPHQHPALCEHHPDPRRPRLSARGRHLDDPDRRPPPGLAGLPAADQCRGAGRASILGRCVRDLRVLRAEASGVRSGGRDRRRAGRRSCRRLRW